MLERMKDLPSGIDGVRAIGKISKDDYEAFFVPLLDEARRQGRRIRFLYQMGPEFVGFTPGAAWEDAKIGLQNMRLFDGCAIVTNLGWIRELTRLSAFLMPCPVSVFGNGEMNDAVSWLQSLPERAAISYQLHANSGVIVVEVKQALRKADFDALGVTADAWIEAHGSLQGIVIRAREFPGWENFGSLVRHVRFVRGHHRQVKRIALAADAKLATIAPKIAEHFIQAEVKTFGYDQIDAAISWAGGSNLRTVAAA